MAVTVKKGSLTGKFGQRGKAAAAAAAKAPIESRNRDLPAGITNGVARLINCELIELDDKTNYKQLDGTSAKGELCLVLSAAVDTPKMHVDNGVPVKVEGRQFRKYIPIFSKGAKGDFGADWDFDTCVKEAAAEMRRIAGEGFDTSDFDGAVTSLAKANPKPRFLFSTVMGKASTKPDPKTGKPYPPRLNVYWNGSEGLADDVPPDPTAAVEDGTPAGDEQPFTGDLDSGDQPDGEQQEMTLAEMAALVDANPKAVDTEGTDEHTAGLALSAAAEEKWGADVDLGAYGSWAEIVEAIEATDEPEPEPEPEPAPPPKRPAPKPVAKPAPKAAPKPAPKPAPKTAPKRK